MVEEKDLLELAEYQAETPILSVYLNVDPTELTPEEYKLALRQMLKEADRLAAPEDIAAVERYFDFEYDWSGRGVAVFSCAAEEYWRAYSLAVPVASGVTVARKPYVSPLAALMDAYGRFSVVLVDRQGARLFLFDLGELQTTEEVTGEEVRRLKRGRGSSAGAGRRGGAGFSSRHEEKIAERNLRDAADATAQFCKQHDPQRLIIAGAEPTTTQFRELLPKRLQKRVVGSFPAEMTASLPEILVRALELLQEEEEEREAKVVEAVFTAAAKGRGGVIRLDDTLDAANQGRIQTLVIARDYHAPGYQCGNCRYVTTQRLGTCPFCGGEFLEIPDAAEAVVTKVIENGGVIEVVDDHPLLEQAGIGALLRY